jgi:hypothetical protein
MISAARRIIGPFISLRHCIGESKSSRIRRVMRYWEIITDNLSKAGWSWGCVSAVTNDGRIIWVADAHRDDGKRSLCTPMIS